MKFSLCTHIKETMKKTESKEVREDMKRKREEHNEHQM